ncbi:hypothetical protein [Streptomyces sp. B6B3]|uniref:hypothetical protein n=1 Tax=Streptomyces sp. B6B3 TaxID=3153570 RepID=UPI00325DBB98
MTAHAHRSGVGTRLRWWALLLPVVAFSALLALLLGGTGADRETLGEPPAPGELIAHLTSALLP